MKRSIQVISYGCLTGALLVLSGCSYFTPPPAADIPPNISGAKKPERATETFTPEEGVVHWKDTALNIPNDSKKPDKFQVTRIDSGELIWARSVKTIKTGKPPQDVKTYGIPEAMHVAGIVTPAPGQPGWAETVNKVKGWTMSIDPKTKLPIEVDIEQDPVFPQDLNARPMVQVWFPSPGKGGQTWNLARMLIHTGYAVADINSPTSLDIKPWFNDEQFARTYIDPKTNKLAPLGLWGKGIILAQRQSPPIPKGTPVLVTNVTQVQTKVKGATKTTRASHITTITAKDTTPKGAAGGTAAGGNRAGANGKGMVGKSVPSSSGNGAITANSSAKLPAPAPGTATKTTSTTTTTKTSSSAPKTAP
ncbi:MAG: hypothetical protein JO316_15270 [Abitibacteriaceae bacterium]|nr:hypothetical protein [Abditibacteriaceae bacterium]